MKVLIADDERIVRIGLKTMIKWEDYGYELAGTAEDGETAFEMVSAYRPDIIITDLKMPKMDGLELVRRLLEIGFKGKVIVLSNYGEYEMVREAMKNGAFDYLLKVTLKTEELVEVLAKASKELDKMYESHVQNVKLQSAFRQHEEIKKNNLLRDLMIRNLDSRQFQDRMEQLQIKCAEAYFFSLFISRTELEAKEGKIKDKGLFSFSIRNITAEMLSEWPGSEIVEIDFSTFMVVIPVSDHISSHKQLQAAGNVGRTLELYLNERLIVTVSRLYQGWNQLGLAYRICREAASAVFYQNEEESPRIIEAFKPYFSVQWFHNYHYQLLAEAKKSLDQMDVLSLEELFLNVCASAELQRIHPEQLTSFACALIDLLLVKGAEEGVSADEISVTIHNKLRQSLHVKQLIVNFTEAIEMTRKQFVTPERKIWRKEIVQAVDYMKEHAHEKITLGQIAREVSLNDSYLSRLFKLETGRNIVHFLNELRMERAVELMKDPNLKLKEIAEKVGIEDPFYFNRLFKKHYNMSPSEYKNRQMNFSK